MSSQTFTPSEIVEMSKEKDWAANIGMIDWDTTRIVFTKRTLIEFLKYTGVTVDTNYSNISKLPRYATFGKMIGISPEASVDDGRNVALSTSTGSVDPGRPSRRVRTVPGGQSSNIFEVEFDDDALAGAPNRMAAAPPDGSTEMTTTDTETNESAVDTPAFKPSRRVRTGPGGKDSLSGWWDGEQAEEFKPTRKVRQVPGGHDNLSGIL